MLPALEIPVILQHQYDACVRMQHLIDTGEVLYTQQGLARFVRDRNNFMLVESVKAFLKGKKLFEKDDVLRDAYYDYLTTDPAARASLMVLKQHLSEGVPVPMNDLLRGYVE